MCIYIYIHVYVCIYIYIYTHTCVHARTHAYTHVHIYWLHDDSYSLPSRTDAHMPQGADAATDSASDAEDAEDAEVMMCHITLYYDMLLCHSIFYLSIV